MLAGLLAARGAFVPPQLPALADRNVDPALLLRVAQLKPEGAPQGVVRPRVGRDDDCVEHLVELDGLDPELVEQGLALQVIPGEDVGVPLGRELVLEPLGPGGVAERPFGEADAAGLVGDPLLEGDDAVLAECGDAVGEVERGIGTSARSWRRAL